MSLRPDAEIADLSLAGLGQLRIAWSDAEMPVLASVRERFAASVLWTAL